MKLQTTAQPVPPVIAKTPPAGPPPGALPPKPKHAVADRLTASELLFRIVVVAFMAGSLFLAWWSFAYVLAKPQKELKDLTQKYNELSREVEMLERAFTGDQQAALEKKFAQAQSMFLREELSSWAGKLQQEGSKLNLELAGRETSSGSTLTNLGVGRVSVHLEVTPANLPDLETSYQRLLRLSQHLATPGTRCDMPELLVVGGSNSVAKATMVLNLWTNDPGAIQ